VVQEVQVLHALLGDNMIFAGFDLGSNFGYAILAPDGMRIDSGTWSLGKRSGKSLSNLYMSMSTVLTSYADLVVSYELVRGTHSGKNAAHAYGGYEAILWMVCYDADIPSDRIVGVSVQQIKKAATGFSNADKDEVEAAAYSKWLKLPDDNNESDALWCAEVSRLKYNEFS